MEKIKKISCVTIAVVVLVSIVCIPTFAYTDTSLNEIDFEDQPIPTADPTNLSNEEKYDAGFEVVSYTSSGTLSELSYFSTSNENVYAFGWKQSDSEYRFILASTTAFDFVKGEKRTTGSGTVSYLSGKASTASYNQNEQLYVMSTQMTVSASHNPTFNIPIFATRNDGVAALKDWINEQSTPGESAVAFSYNVAPGYALFVDIHGLTGLSGNLTTTTTQAFASPHTSNQTLSYQSSIPSGNIAPQGNGINWMGTGNKDLFGRYKSWTRSLIINPNSTFIAIYNPVHVNSYLDPEHEDFNGTIHVSVSSAYASTSILVPLNTELTSSGQVGTTTTDDQKPMQYDSDTNTWYPTNQDGTPYTPSPYGDYMPATSNSIHDWLQNIANLISGFFEGAIGAVTTLVNAGSAFIHQLISLYSWLPAPVYAVLSSALILVITIGVIKVFI